jgi:hypothetical protein
MYRLTPDMTNTREALNEPVAQTLTSIIQVLAEGRQIDVRDMALILGGHGEQFVGHADMRSMDPSEEEIADYVRQCLDNEYLVFKHQVGLAAIAIYPGPNWPTSTRGAIAMAIRDELTRREREAYDEARKQDPSLPEEYESRYQPIVGCYPRPTDCGITVMLSQYDPNHKPLELKLPTRSRAQGMSQRLAELAASPAQPPHGGDRAFPPAGGKADFSTPREGAPTAPSHPTNGFRATWPVTVHRTTLRFSEFMDSLRHNDPSAIALAAGEVDLTKVSLPTSGVKSVVNEERFARLLADQKFSPSWRKFLLDEYLREHPVVLQRDGQIRSGPLPWKKRTLKTVEPEALAGLNEKSVGDGDRELLKLLQTVFKVWGADETRFCQAQIKASLDHSGELPAAAAAHTA